MFVDVLELIVMCAVILARIAATVFLVYLIITRFHANGWIYLLVAFTILIGLGFFFKYENPNVIRKTSTISTLGLGADDKAKDDKQADTENHELTKEEK